MSARGSNRGGAGNLRRRVLQYSAGSQTEPGADEGLDSVTRRQDNRVRRLFPTTGGDNNKCVPWRSSLTLYPAALIAWSLILWAMSSIGIELDWWAAAPSTSGIVTLSVLCGTRKDGTRVRHQLSALTTAGILWLAVAAGGVHVFHAGHAHPGLPRWAVYTIATLVAVCGFTLVNRHDSAAVPQRGTAQQEK
jgi:hypothetical protein